MGSKFRRKTIKEMRAHAETKTMAKTLSWPQLIALGIGAIIGSGIYILVGAASAKAGPAVIYAFVFAGIVCACAGLAYAELASMIPISGGAYSYTYSSCGEVIAWLVGWTTLFGYILSLCFVAVGWSSYCSPYMVILLHDWGIDLPYWLLHSFGTVDASTGAQGFVNLPAIVILFLTAGLLMLGTQGSALVNAVLVALKLGALILFIALALPYFHAANLHPFMPYGFFKSLTPEGVELGVMPAASMVFLAFYGVDTVATAAEETKNPEKNLSIGMIGSLACVIIIYMLVCVAALGAMRYTDFMSQNDVLSYILRSLNMGWAAAIIALVAILALPTVLLSVFYAVTRILFTISRDGLVSPIFAKMGKNGSPVMTIIITAILAAVVAGFLPFDKIVVFANAGPMALFTMIGVSLLILRQREPDAPRGFRVPCGQLVGAIVVLGCLYLFWNLPGKTQIGFIIWNLLGLVVYFLYGRNHSALAEKRGLI